MNRGNLGIDRNELMLVNKRKGIDYKLKNIFKNFEKMKFYVVIAIFLIFGNAGNGIE